MATRIAWIYGCPTRRVERTQRDHGDAVAGRSSSAMSRGKAQICDIRPTRKRWLKRSDM